jgi:hypothetical protein
MYALEILRTTHQSASLVRHDRWCGIHLTRAVSCVADPHCTLPVWHASFRVSRASRPMVRDAPHAPRLLCDRSTLYASCVVTLNLASPPAAAMQERLLSCAPDEYEEAAASGSGAVLSPFSVGQFRRKRPHVSRTYHRYDERTGGAVCQRRARGKACPLPLHSSYTPLYLSRE